jgi:hypothetical protein
MRVNEGKPSLRIVYVVPAGDASALKKNASCAGVVEGIVAGCYGRRSDGRSAVDAQDDPEVGGGVGAAWCTGEPCDRGQAAAGTEVLVAIQPQAAGRKTRPVPRPTVPPLGASPTTIPTAGLARNQRGHEEKGVGGQLQEWRACLAVRGPRRAGPRLSHPRPRACLPVWHL